MIGEKPRRLVIGLCFVAVLGFLAGCSSEASKRRLLETGNKYHSSAKYKEASIIYRKLIQKDPLYGEAYYRLGLNELKLGRYADAVRALRRASDLQPDNDDAHTQLGNLYLTIYLSDRDRYKNILAEFEELADKLYEKNPQSFTALRMKGYQSVAGNRPAEATEFFRKAMEIDDSDPGVRVALIQATYQADRKQEAEDLAWSFIEKDPAYGPVYDFLYLLRMRDNKPAEAEAILRKKLENNPKNWQPYVELATHYMRQQRRDDMKNAIAKISDDPAAFPAGSMIAGDFYLRIGMLDLAEQEFRKGLSRGTDKRNYEKKIVEVLLTQGRRKEALEITERLVEEDGNDPQAKALRAMLRLQGANAEELKTATLELEGVIAQMPENPVVRFNLAEAYLAQGRVDQAVVQLQESLRIRPSYLPPMLVLGRIHLQKKEFPRALALSEDIIRLAPRMKEGRLIRLGALLGQGDFDRVRNESQQLLRDFPGLNDAVYLIATADFMEKKYADAERGYRRLLDSTPPDPRGLNGVVECALATGRAPEAIRLLEERIEKGENVRAARMQLALAASRSGNYDRAIREFQQLIAEHPKSPELHIRLGEVYRFTKRFDEAEQSFRKARDLSPNDQIALVQSAMLFEQTGRRMEAKPLYEQLLKLSPDNPIALNNYAYLLAETGDDLDQALTYAQRARQRLPKNDDVADTLGWIYIKKNLSDDAITIFRDLLTRRPDHVTWRYHLAMALFQKGDKLEAKRELQTALRNNPSGEESAKIRELLDRIG